MAKKQEIDISLDYIFHNKYTEKDERYVYYLTPEDAGEVIREYISLYNDEVKVISDDPFELYRLVYNIIIKVRHDKYDVDYAIEQMAEDLRQSYGEDRFEEIFSFREKAEEEFNEWIEETKDDYIVDDEVDDE